MTRIIKTDSIQLSGGTFGLERETLRVTKEGYMAQTVHPFDGDDHIVKDFCENQAEINTGVHDTAQGAVDELAQQSKRLTDAIKEQNESIWLYSNPPYIRSEDEIPVALYEGEDAGKHSYRLYLAKKYGKYKMTLSGIHVNYSLSEELLQNTFSQQENKDFFEYKNASYLRLAQGLSEYGFLINLLLSASPVCDVSYFSPERTGEMVITKYASVRCGKEGYWNTFTPIFNYNSLTDYAESIQKYINSGILAGAGELYYPVRLKPKGTNRLNNLVQNGVNHIELRNIDINPFSDTGLDVRDLEFIELLILWVFSTYDKSLSENDQNRIVENYKASAMFDIDNAYIYNEKNERETIRAAGLRVLGEMQKFYSNDISASGQLRYQFSKLTQPYARYAEKVSEIYKNNYVKAIPHGDCAEDAQEIFLAECIKRPQ